MSRADNTDTAQEQIFRTGESKTRANRQDKVFTILCDDNRRALAGLPESSIDLIITSPPYYKLREYGMPGLGNEKEVEDYLEALHLTFLEMVRVIKPTGNIAYNIGDSSRGGSMQLLPYRFAAQALTVPGIRLVNQITWAKTNPVPQHPTKRLVPGTEPVFHFALGKDYYHDKKSYQPKENSPHTSPTLKKTSSKYRKMIETAVELNDKEKRDAIRKMENALSEVHAGKIANFRMKIRGIHDPSYGGQKGGRNDEMQRTGSVVIRMPGESLKRDVIETTVENDPGNDHPAPFAMALARELIRLLCPVGGTVLDPHLGSGTVMLAAEELDRSCVGIELNPEYCQRAWKRLEQRLKYPRLF